MRKVLVAVSLLFVSCVSNNSSRNPDAVTDKKLLESREGVQRQKFFASELPNNQKSGRESSEKEAIVADAVAVYLPGEKTKYVQKPSRTYNISSVRDVSELAALLIYVDSYKPNLKVAINANLKMGVQSVQKRGERTAVKFEQYVEREVSATKYRVPVVGSGVVVSLKNNQVVSMLSGITNPPEMGIVFQNPGFDLSQVSGKELELIRSQMQDFGKTETVKKYLANVAENTGQKFDFDAWTKENTSVQLQLLKNFFAGIKKTSTAKILIDMARMKRLGFIKRNDQWNLQVTKLFGMPIEFDLEIPTTTEQKLMVKNIRDLRREVTIEVHSSPSFPAFGPIVSKDDEVPTGAKIDHVTGLFQGILGYYRQMHNWVGPNGDNSSFKLEVHKDIADGDYVENAFWAGAMGVFGIGAGGTQLHNFDRSISVLGHEYGHAMVEATSNLVYQGQSGALNEHIADVQGVQVEAFLTGNPYSFVIGSDIVTPEAAAPRQKIVDLVLSAQKVPAEDISRFNLKKISLRNMYQPSVSLYAQPSTVAEGEALGYGPKCVPSANNDYCGVHYLSGIPNRATSLLIGRYGESEMRGLLFNTAFFRLNSTSNFSEYARQMHEECLDNPKLNEEVCDYVVSAFDSVGVQIPDGDSSKPEPPLPDTGGGTPAPDPKKPESPPLKMCGWISISASNNITVIDNKYDTVILNSANAAKFGGNFTKIQDSDFKLWKHKECGCVTGSISQTPNSKNVWFNYFLEVKPGAVLKHKSTAGCKSIVFK